MRNWNHNSEIRRIYQFVERIKLTVSELIKEVISQLKQTGIEKPVIDAEVIISHVLNIERFMLIIEHDRKLTADEIKKITVLVKRRLNFEPLAYIICKKEFYSLDFFVNSNVLIPRQETELLVDLVLYYAMQNATVLDLGTGSGAIAISVKYNRTDLAVIASDISSKALEVAKKNSENLLGGNSIEFFSGNLFESFSQMRFDIIAANPPYINRNLSDSLQKELSFEPEIALFSEECGKKITARIIREAKHYIEEGGILIIEIGDGMRDFVMDTGEINGYTVTILSDYSGLPRVAILK